MPNRYIRESWIDSAAVDQLDAASERFFLRLILKADDFGRYTANPVALKNTLFPLKEDVRSTDSSRWLAACEKAGLIRCYETPKGRFLEIPKFGQRARATASKFPALEEAMTDKGRTDDGQTAGRGPASAPEDEDEDEDGIRGRVAGADVGQAPKVPSSLNTPEFLKAWDLWVRARKGMKKAKDWNLLFQTQLDWLTQFGPATACSILGNSTRNGYQGLFEPKTNANHNHRSTASGPAGTPIAIDAALAARLASGGDEWPEAEGGPDRPTVG